MNLNGRLSSTGSIHGSMGASLVANVEANPAGAASEILTKIRVGDTIYKIPSGGGGGGVTSYSLLSDKPKINNHTIDGDMTSTDLDLQDKIVFPGDGSKYLDGDGNFTIPAAPPLNYSTSEFDTGKRWIDGRTIYGIVYDNLGISVPSGGKWTYLGLTIPDVEFIANKSFSDGTNNWFGALFYGSGQLIVSAPYSFTLNKLYVEYVKTS